MVELDNGLQLVGGVVGVLDGVAGLIGYAGQIAGAVVGIDDRRVVRVGRLDQPLAGVVLKLRGVAVGVGAGDLIARVVVGVGEVALDARDSNKAAGGVVGVGGGVVERVGLADLAPGVVVGVGGGAGARCAVAAGNGDQTAGEIVGVERDVAGLVGCS